MQQVVAAEWGGEQVRAWNTSGWIELSRRIGNKIARLVGAGNGELVVADSTSVNLFKVVSVALDLAAAEAPKRRIIVSERHNFPTDLYMAESVARGRGIELRLVEADEIPAHLTDEVAVLMLTHVNYRDGRMHDMAAINRAAHAVGALVVWDLAHSAGAMPIDLNGNGDMFAAADFAVGCGYKYLNGGPGAPAFVWAHPRHTERMDALKLWQPLSGWFGHAAPFEFQPGYRPGAGIARFHCGTRQSFRWPRWNAVSTHCLQPKHLEVFRQCAKSLALTEIFMALVDAHCGDHGLTLQTPRDPHLRGSQVSYAHAEGAYAIMQALIARNVIGDFRAPDVLRFGSFRSTHASPTFGMPWCTCGRCWIVANGARPASVSAAQ